jgi:hypothetical protein
MGEVRRCLGCQDTYPVTEAACPKCGSYAAEVEQEKTTDKAKPPRQRKP